MKQSNVRVYLCLCAVIEPFLVFLIAYLSYILALFCTWSGIIRCALAREPIALQILQMQSTRSFYECYACSLIVCGLVQAQYAFYNMHEKSSTTVKYFAKTASCVVCIALYLGLQSFTNYSYTRFISKVSGLVSVKWIKYKLKFSNE